MQSVQRQGNQGLPRLIPVEMFEYTFMTKPSAKKGRDPNKKMAGLYSTRPVELRDNIQRQGNTGGLFLSDSRRWNGPFRRGHNRFKLSAHFL